VDRRDETSIWKKEISLRRKPKTKAAKTEAPVVATPEETSIWKKEITFRRKPKPKTDYVPVPPERQTGPVSVPGHQRPAFFDQPLGEVLLPPVTLAPRVTPPVDLPAAPAAELSALPPVAPPIVSAGAPQPTGSEVGPQRREAIPSIEPVFGEPVDEIVLPHVTKRAEPPSTEPLGGRGAPPVTPPVVPSGVWQPPAGEPEPDYREPSSATEPVLDGPPVEVNLSSVTPPVVSSNEQLPVPEPRPEPVKQAPAEVAPIHGAKPTPGPEPVEEQEPKPALSRRERRNARRAADRLAKDQRKRGKQIAKRERKANPSMHTRVVGLKVGASQIAAAEVINKAGPRVVRMARTPLKRGVVVGGELREPDELAAALKTFFRKNRLRRTCVRLGVSNNRIGVRTFEIAGIEDEKQLANAIRFRAQETLPIPLDEAVLDYRILDDRLDEDGVRVRRVLLVVAHRELVERYVAACRKAGLKLIGIDLEAFALLRALADPARPPAEDAASVCITIGHDRSTLAVANGRVCEFTRVLSWGGHALDVALAGALDLTPSNAETIRRELSLADEGEGAGLDARAADEARRMIVGELQVFAREIVASLRFYQEQPSSLGISEILVTGGTAGSEGLGAELERLIGIPVRVADPLARVRVPRKLRNAQNGSAGSFAVAVGLGIED
jgi:type IV pilus assembly protein PilM